MNLELDDYEASNLRWLIRVALGTQLNNGDWCGQLFFKLEKAGELGRPNGGENPEEVGKEIRLAHQIAHAAKRYHLARKASHEASMAHASTPELRLEVERAADDLCAVVEGFYRS